MIVVAGFHTAIDTLVEVDALQPGAVHRCRQALRLPGGKGLHVAQTASALGANVQLVGLSDSMHRDLLTDHLRARGVDFHGVETARVRECLALRESDGRITELLGAGAEVDGATCARLRDTFLAFASEASIAVLSGSLPPGCPPSMYAELVEALRPRGVRCFVDASGDALRHALDARPFLVKPNRDEAAELLQRPIPSLEAAFDTVASLHDRGVAMPLLSLGADGALLVDAGSVLHGRLTLDRVVNPVGSGDCLLAGMAYALSRGNDIGSALRLGVACGGANAAALETGYAEPALVQALLPRVSVDAFPLPTSTNGIHP